MGLAIPTDEAMAAAAIRTRSFEHYLIANEKRNFRQILCYAKKYRDVLVAGDASSLMQVKSPAVRRHVLEALCLYSKHVGCYNLFKDIRAKHQLGWASANEDNLRYFTNYLYGHGNLEMMMIWLKDTLQKVPSYLGNVLLYITLSGLRPSEALLSIRLIQTDFEHYANEELGILENFRHPDFVSKKTKKAYLTVYDDSILHVALNAKPYNTWKAVRSQLKRCGVDSVHTKYCRAIFATWLRKYGGIEQEIISLYHGRVPNTVFQASYLKTNIKEDRKRILRALEKLQKNLLTR